MTVSITLVLFDMEGVLSHYDRTARAEHLAARVGRTPETVRYAIWGSGLEARADAGEIGDDDYLRELGILLNCPINRDDWLAARRASITPNEAALEVAAKVAERHRIAVLTNNCRLLTEHIGYLNPPVARLFGPHVYSSASYGAAKPAAQTYLRCLDQLGVPAAQTLFVDDTAANVSGAIDAGLHGHRFVSVEALSRELQSRGLI
ncbi:HAD family hydrolase [Paraburkholderia aromaticivorans]|uniref:HAD family hydrolase n=1 Tax=Paraburkholderia aromaticivorans TaxID=2026199 RepID=A0A248VRR6_9BURK|nr:HAD family phosphatase [Paraburkholderia aromaticivorans]ASW01050.1 HAD family hydrolase [Paraburkholderia aromaticivorans]